MDLSEHQLFVDDAIIESAVRLPRRYPGPHYDYGPVLEPAHPWEGAGTCIFGSVHRDPETGRFRMWYLGYSMGTRYGKRQFAWSNQSAEGLDRVMNLCYAESDNGVHWEKPELGLVEWRGSTANNVVATEVSNPTVIEDPLDPDPNRRYKIFRHGSDPTIPGEREEQQGHYVAFSPDGLHLSEWQRIIPRHGDRHCFMYDPSLERPWVCYTRPPGYWPRYERRMVARLDSADLVEWSDAEVVLVPGLDDPEDTQFYSLVPFPYQGMYLGFLQRMYANEDRLNIELVSSRDSRTWQRAGNHATWFDVGPGGSWKSAWVQFAHNPPVDVYGDLYLYYEGRSGAHVGITPGPNAKIGLAVMFTDRFASLLAGTVEGRLVTKPFVCPGGKLVLNANPCATVGRDFGSQEGPGHILTEILDQNGDVVPGYGKCDCVRWWRDYRRGAAVCWEENRDLDPLKGKKIKVKFYLSQAEICSFWCEQGEDVEIVDRSIEQAFVEGGSGKHDEAQS